MITTIKNAVFQKPVFEKVADYELPKDVAEWNDEIMKQFFATVDYIPKEYGVDVVVNHIDENSGYAKGSVVVFNSDRKINFPVIVKDYKLSPFDVVAYKDGDKIEYSPASERQVKKLLASQQMGTVEDKRFGGGSQGDPKLKNPGGVSPKDSVNINDSTTDVPYLDKMSSLASKGDLQKLAAQLQAEPDVMSNFVDNTGELVSNIIDLGTGDTQVSAKDRQEGTLDMGKIVKAKQAITAIDSDLFDVSSLSPIEPPSVCELRCYEYPSMEDFMQSGEGALERFQASRIGSPIAGIVVDFTDFEDLKRDSNKCYPICGSPDSDELKDKKELRERRSQIFISADGKHYSTFSDYDKTGIGFYGSALNSHGLMEKIVARIASKSTDEFINVNQDNRGDGSDRLLTRVQESYQGKADRYPSFCEDSDGRMLCVFGAGSAFECVEFRGAFKKYKVNSSNVYVSKEVCVIPARVANIQRVGEVNDEVYKMIVGKCDNIFLIPESSVMINTRYMSRLNSDDLMHPSKSMQKVYEEANINKVALYVDISGGGYRIAGKPFEKLAQIAHIDRAMNSTEVISAMQIMGMQKSAAHNALQVSLNRASQGGNGFVEIYGVNDDYINTEIFADREKIARMKPIFAEIADQLRVNLVKEASELDDQKAVDVVLSLNFINQDNLKDYIEQIYPMKKVGTKLASMLIASRMGLKEIDEGAVKKAMDSLGKVIDGLEEVKMAIGG
jgi:hypothetical protein